MLNGAINCSIAAINRAIKIAGSVAELAKKMEVSSQAVYHWRTRGLPPYEFAARIFKATNGEVGIEDLCHPTLKPLARDIKTLYIRIYRRRKTYGKTKRDFNPVQFCWSSK